MQEPERRPPWPFARFGGRFDAWWLVLRVFFGGDGRDSIFKPPLSSGEIVEAFAVTVVDNATIAVAAEIAASAEAETLP